MALFTHLTKEVSMLRNLLCNYTRSNVCTYSESLKRKCKKGWPYGVGTSPVGSEFLQAFVAHEGGLPQDHTLSVFWAA